MRNEKKLLVGEIVRYLAKSSYAFFTDFRGVTVAEMSNLRKKLSGDGGEFHVVKKTLLKKAAEDRSLPLQEREFDGQIAMVVGGKNPAAVAKILRDFFRSSKSGKLAMRGGLLDGKFLTPADVEVLSDLPGMEVLRAQLLSLLSAPASKFVRLLNAVPQSMLNVLQARAKV
jgi:large subunit ribosomal protein L10